MIIYSIIKIFLFLRRDAQFQWDQFPLLCKVLCTARHKVAEKKAKIEVCRWSYWRTQNGGTLDGWRRVKEVKGNFDEEHKRRGINYYPRRGEWKLSGLVNFCLFLTWGGHNWGFSSRDFSNVYVIALIVDAQKRGWLIRYFSVCNWSTVYLSHLLTASSSTRERTWLLKFVRSQRAFAETKTKL